MQSRRSKNATALEEKIIFGKIFIFLLTNKWKLGPHYRNNFYKEIWSALHTLTCCGRLFYRVDKKKMHSMVDCAQLQWTFGIFRHFRAWESSSAVLWEQKFMRYFVGALVVSPGLEIILNFLKTRKLRGAKPHLELF